MLAFNRAKPGISYFPQPPHRNLNFRYLNLLVTAIILWPWMLTEAPGVWCCACAVLLHVCLCVRINLRVVSDPLRASLPSFAYTANTASWYSVRELRCCNTTEVSLPSTTACGGVQEGESRFEWWMRGAEESDGVQKGMGEERGGGAGGQRTAGEMENGTINVGRRKWQMEERKTRTAGREREIEREWKRKGNNRLNELDEAPASKAEESLSFRTELNGWQLWYRLDVG